MANLKESFEQAAARYCPQVPIATFDYAVNISLRHRYLYVETPKVACSSIKTTLQRLELDDAAFYRKDFEDVHNRVFSPLLKPSQVGDLDSFLARRDVFKFCFVRNPYTRLLSAWLDKIEGNRRQKAQILLQLGHDPGRLNHEVPFGGFVRAVAAQPVSVMDAHWRAQYYQTFQSGIAFDFVGRFESLERDLRLVLGRIRGDFETFLAHEQRRSTGADARLGEFYTPELHDLVFEKYRIDFEAFDYDRALPQVSHDEP